MRRWITYQRERFPLAAHAPLVAAFSVSAVCYTVLLRRPGTMPSRHALAVAFGTALLFFLQLRIADEFKDAADDARFRPYRPVPRGLVTLPELGRVAAGAAVIQLLLALSLDRSLVVLLAAAWTYLALMTREFFVPEWLKARPIVYMASHMVILPLVDLYATACDWWPAGHRWPPAGLAWFLATSYCNGVVVEIGRKTRAPADEEQGVETYSALWGGPAAAGAWMGAIVATAGCAWMAARRVGTEHAVLALLLVLVVSCAACASLFVLAPSTRRARAIEIAAGVWTLLMYLSLGAVPLALMVWRGR